MRKTLTLLTLAFLASAAFAQSGEEDPTYGLKDALDRLGYSYSYDEQANLFEMIFDADAERNQLLYISGYVHTYGGFTVREIFSPIWRGQQPVPSGVANQLLRQNEREVIGAWNVYEYQGTHVIHFTYKAPHDLSDERLAEAIGYVVSAADGMEDDLYDSDDF